MPDVGTPPRSARLDTHTSTQQWQSFEIKMRHRRAERCVARAEEALVTGREEEARAALAEARALNSAAPSFEDLLAAARRRQAAAAAAKRARQQRTMAAAIIVLALAAGSMAIWLRTSGRSSPDNAAIAAPNIPAAAQTPSAPSPQTPIATQRPQLPVPSSTQPDPGPETEFPVRTSGVDTRTATAASLAAFPQPAPAVAPPEPSLPAVQEVNPASSPNRPTTGGTAAVDSAIPQTNGADGLVRDLPPAALPIVTIPPAPPPPAAERPPVEPPVASEEPKVRAVLAQFETAYSSLSATAAQAVWPSVDARALARAFESLESQHVSLGSCSIVINGSTARAECIGTASWTPRIGGGRRTERRRFEFDLAAENGAWQILQATAK